MSLTPGTRIGPYDVVGPLGVGGMGEVYRARDARLDRDVALKVLPDSFVDDADRVARFQREARVLASLNHPHIAAIHGLEESGGVTALVLELVEGPTLADRLARGPLPIREVLAIARQIADALEAAHEQGIVHRDLKPANIKVRPDGTVKVLDFGLAKAGEAGRAGAAGTASLTESPTIMSPANMTHAGVILGTAAYMSPEQARGQAVDKRTDVWAFGCVLFEMLTGRTPFGRATASDSIAAILEREPDWAALPASTPALVQRLVARCLAKDRQQRLRDIGDARLEIDAALAAPHAVAPSTSERASRRTLPWLVAMLAIAAVGFAVGRFQGDRPAPAADPPFRARLSIAPPLGYQIDLGRSQVSISRDGRAVVFVASKEGVQRVCVRDLESSEAVPIAGTEGGFAPFFSPDGQWIGFFINQKMRKVPRSGGAPVSIADVAGIAGNRSVAGRWEEQDTIFFTPDVTKGIWRVSSDGGTATAVTTPAAGESFHVWPQLLPGGKALLFSAIGDGPDPQAWVQQLDTGERKALVRGVGTRYVATGHLLFAVAGSLVAVPFALDRLEVTGSPVSVESNVVEPFRLRTMAAGFSPLFDLSTAGTLAILSGSPLQHALTWVDRSGQEAPTGASGGQYAQPRLSPDGRRVAVVVKGDDSDDVWLYDLGRNNWGRFTSEGNNGFPTWTLDGTRVAYNSDRSGGVGIEWKRVDGSNASEIVLRADRATHAFPFSWSPDGLLAYVSLRAAQDILVMRPGSDVASTSFLATPFVEGAPMFSPDGRAIAYVSNESGRNEVYIRPFPGPGEKLAITDSGVNEPVWSPTGRELFYRRGDAMMAVDVSTSPTLRAGTPRVLFEKRYEPTLGLYANYSVTADGQRFVMVKRLDAGESETHVDVTLHWIEALKSLAPNGASAESR